MSAELMNLVFLSHPPFLGHQSMPRFARMLAEGMAVRGHDVQLWTAGAVFSKLTTLPDLKKWLGYIDQYITFPHVLRRKVNECRRDTLFVVTDQALGPWVPLLAHRPHVIHCHDFMALQSALGEIPAQKIGWTGRIYQNFIRRGFSKGMHFISVSEKTRKDLSRLLLSPAVSSEVVYNGLHQPFAPVPVHDARLALSRKTNLSLQDGYVLHIGGNAWYKNRIGVIEIYNAWRTRSKINLPMLFVGDSPTRELLAAQQKSPFSNDIYWVSGVDDTDINRAYSGATTLLFPSHGEGFGWPIAEAMASGTLVITTNAAPMTEVAGNAGFLIDPRPTEPSQTASWALASAEVLEKVVTLSSDERMKAIALSLENAGRFDTNAALDRIEAIYKRILEEEASGSSRN